MIQNKYLPTYQQPNQYLPTWESLNEHSLPEWFMDAKFGIFIHWGPYSVPAWAPKKTETGAYYNDTVGNHPYAEIYGYGMLYKDSKVWRHHVDTYGKEFQYEDFFPMFDAKNWDPDFFAKTFKECGAKYSVLVTKHSDCYSMFDTKLTKRSCMHTGPLRDITGEYVKALRSHGLKAGLYYSTTFDWYYRNFPHVIYKEFTHGQLKELIDQYQPDILWSDDYWKPIEKSCSDTWGSKEIISYFYNHSPHPEEILVNDRWGCEVNGRQLGDFSTPEYTVMPHIQEFYWEANRGIGRSFGYNREETEDDYTPADTLIFMLADIVSKNGNLLLNIGPKADGTIPAPMLDRLRKMGDWLRTNGEAIYGTKPWIDAEGVTANKEQIRFTKKKDCVFAMVFGICSDTLTIEDLFLKEGTTVSILGGTNTVTYHQETSRLLVTLPRTALLQNSVVLKFDQEPYRLMQQKQTALAQNRCGELFRRLGYLKVPM